MFMILTDNATTVDNQKSHIHIGYINIEAMWNNSSEFECRIILFRAKVIKNWTSFQFQHFLIYCCLWWFDGLMGKQTTPSLPLTIIMITSASFLLIFLKQIWKAWQTFTARFFYFLVAQLVLSIDSITTSPFFRKTMLFVMWIIHLAFFSRCAERFWVATSKQNKNNFGWLVCRPLLSLKPVFYSENINQIQHFSLNSNI